MANIGKHNGKHRVRWREGTRQRSRSFNKLRAAEEFKRVVEDITRAGKRWEPVVDRPPPHVGEAVKAYLYHLKLRASPRTVLNVGYSLENFATFHGGDLTRVRLDSLSMSMLERFYEWLGKDTGRHGKPRSLDTRAKNVRIVELMWRWAANQDQFTTAIPTPRRLDHLPSDPGNATDAPTWAEMDAAIAQGGSWYPLIMSVMRALGLRVSQTLLLKVKDIRTDALGRLELDFRGELGKTKQERRGRRVPIAPACAPLFALLTKGRGADEWLVPSRPTTRSEKHAHKRDRTVLTRKVAGAWERAGVRAEVWAGRPDHAFRKGFNTGLRLAGADKDAVELLVGHSLGLSGIYTAAFALNLTGAAALVPAFSEPAWLAIKTAFDLVAAKEKSDEDAPRP